MFFVFGSPRSGTTLLAQMLDRHDRIVIPHETDFIIPMAFIHDRIRDPNVGKGMVSTLITSSAAFATSLGEYLEPGEVMEIVAMCDYHPAVILEALYGAVARKTNAWIAGDKSPNDLLFLRMLIKVGGISPTMKIIHIVRDVRDLMVSLNAVGWGNDFDLWFPRFWSNSNLYLHSLFRNDPSRYCLVRYEDLVADPTHWADRICSFLGVSFMPAMLDAQRIHPRYASMGHHTKLFQPVTPSNVGVYRDRLGPAILENYERQAREGLETFGYLSR